MKRIHYLTTLILTFEVVSGINNKIFTGTNITTGVNTTNNRGTIRYKEDIVKNSNIFNDGLVVTPPYEKNATRKPVTDKDRRTFKFSEIKEKVKINDFNQPLFAFEASTIYSKPFIHHLSNPTKATGIDAVKEINGNLDDDETTITELTSPFDSSNLDDTDYSEPLATDFYADSAPRVAFHGDQKKKLNFQDDKKESLQHADLILPDNQKQRPENQLIFEDNQKDKVQQQFTFQDDGKDRPPHHLVFKADQNARPQNDWTFDGEKDKDPQNLLSFQDDRNKRKQKKLSFEDDKNLSESYKLRFQEDNQRPSHQLNFQEDQNQGPTYQLTFQEDDNKKHPYPLTFKEDDTNKHPYQSTFEEGQNQRPAHQLFVEDQNQRPSNQLNFPEHQYQTPQYQQTQFGQVPVAQHQSVPGQIPVSNNGQKRPQRKRRRRIRQYYPVMEEQSKPLMVVQDVLSMLLQNDKKKCMLKLFCDQAHELISQPQNTANSLRGAIDSVLYVTKMLPILTQRFGDNIGKLGSAMSAFMEAASTGRTSGLHGCRKAYPDCPADPVEMANYIATFNGGFTRLFNGENYTYNSFNMQQDFASVQGLGPEYSGQYGFEPQKLTPGQYYSQIPPVSPQYTYGSSNYHPGYQSYQQNYQSQGYQPDHQQNYQSQGYQHNHQQNYHYHPIPNYKQGYQYNHKTLHQQDYFNYQVAQNG